MFDVLGEPELLQAFGAQSVWQLIERVQQQALGGARNVARFRSQANAGSLIFEWLASAAGAQADTGGAGDDAALAEAVESLLSAMTAAEPHDLLAAVEGGRKAGFSALFLGSPGSGKTLAAHVLASTLELPIMRVDLSRVVSQYIGETEKNLAALFEQAEQKDFVLFFDEADALFGRRTEVRYSHDRYANEAIDYLLQRIEAYEGALIVASNSPKNSDAALTRGGARRRWRVVRFPR
jgi:SpoVK/Ycf46/Vps4 family AAA+-type ATPase